MLSGGFVGVDIFFVISGYLITSILSRDLENGQFSIVQFYERRARRILPALLLVAAVSLPFALWLLLPRDLEEYFESIAGIATFSSNFVFYWQSDYFDTDSAMKPLLHTWSLAVEEQYYILFPPVLALIWRWNRHKVLPLLLVALFGSFALAEIAIRVDPSAAFYMLPTRAWELALGGILALLALEGRWQAQGASAQAGSLAGLIMIAAAILLIDEGDPFPGLAALLPTVGAALVIHCAHPGTFAHRLLGLRAMVGIGLISYSAYLWHQPLFAFARHYYFLDLPPYLPPYLPAALVVATLVLAYLSWRFVEAPFRDRVRIRTRPIFVMSGIGLASLIAVGLVGQSTAPSLASRAEARVPRLFDYRYDNRALHNESWKPLRDLMHNSRYGIQTNSEDEKLWFDIDDKRQKILVIGNSHSKDIFNTLVASSTITREYQIARFGIQIDRLPGRALTSPNYRAADIIVIASRYLKKDLDNLTAAVQVMRQADKRVVLVKSIFEFPQYKHGRLNEADRQVLEFIDGGGRDSAALVARTNRIYFEQYKKVGFSQRVRRVNAWIDEIARKYPDVIAVSTTAAASNAATAPAGCALSPSNPPRRRAPRAGIAKVTAEPAMDNNPSRMSCRRNGFARISRSRNGMSLR